VHWRDIKIFRIAGTAVDLPQMQGWLYEVGAKDYKLPTPHYPDSERDCSHAEHLVGHAAKRCYMSFEPGLNPNVTRVRKNWVKFLDNILESGHGSVLEHASHSYAIENVSRVFTGEMNRHRAGVAISEGSMRFIKYDNVPMTKIPSLEDPDEDFGILDLDLENGPSKKDIEVFKDATKKTIEYAVNNIEGSYRLLCQIWEWDGCPLPFDVKKKLTSLFRRILPMGVCTGGVWTMNLRALRHILALRTTEHAEEEIAQVFCMIGKDIVERDPIMFGDFILIDGRYWSPRHEKV
jgi:thymidylate synthase (FAD)